MRIISATIITTYLLLLTILPSLTAQDITPTAAPSKTPIPPTNPEPEATKQNLTEPWIQKDLSILTGNVQRPNGMIWFDNHLYTICTGDSTIYEIDPNTAATRTYIWGIRNAHTLYAEPSDTGVNLWIPDFQANRLLRIDRNGVETINSELAGPWGIAHLTDTEFLISNLQANNVIVINRTGQTKEIITNLRSPTGIATDLENIYVANTGSARRAIEWISKQEVLQNEGSTSETRPLVTGLQNTTGMVMAPDGYLYFAYSLGTRGVVGRVNPLTCLRDGGCTNDQVEIVVFTELVAPLAGLTISPDMQLFVHTIFSPDIYWVRLDEPHPVQAASAG
jgi:glucose/arabinose dehydrogenase